MGTVTVNRLELLRFMNSGVAEANGHHTALTGLMGEPLAVGLVLHYLHAVGKQAQFISWKVTQGTRRGPRLDAWLLVDGTLYQTEIKMWAGNAIGGLRLADGLSDEQLREKGQKQWRERIWNVDEHQFHSPNVGKVLEPMQKPAGYENLSAKPLLVLWWLVQSEESAAAWFSVPLPQSGSLFTELQVFSLTHYLLSLKDDFLELEMPRLSERLHWLERIFP